MCYNTTRLHGIDEDIGNAFGNTLNTQAGSRFLLLARAFFWSVTPVHSLDIATSRGIDDYDTDCNVHTCVKLRYILNKTGIVCDLIIQA